MRGLPLGAVCFALLATECSRRPSTDGSAGPNVPPSPGRQTVAPRAPETPTTVAPAATGNVFERSVPPFSEAVLTHLRTLFGAGHRAGNRSDVFAKIGDSITESGSFAQDLGHGWYELGEYTRLEPVIAFFRRRAFSRDREDNSYSRGSLAATAGWTTVELLEGGDTSPVERELRALRPAFAVVMVGTNDAERLELDAYETNLGAILDRVEAHQVIAMLSTIPEQRSAPEVRAKGLRINEIIRRVALARRLPLIDYHAALVGLPNAGLCEDNIHPSVFVENGDSRAGVFTSAGLRGGYNVRNLLLLFALARVTEAVGAQ